MTAPESVVQAIMEALGCRKEFDKFLGDRVAFCVWHQCRWLLDRDGCNVAVRAADAAFGASLEWAAERLDEGDEHFMALRRWVGES